MLTEKSLKTIPIGVTDFAVIIEKNYYYVDKTLLIHELITRHGQATLIPRPSRFGKTINMSMLQYFLEKRTTDQSYLFKNLAIAALPECMEHQGCYPVISLSFKGVKHDTWPECQTSLYSLIIDEFRRHKYLLDGAVLDISEKDDYRAVMTATAGSHLYHNALKHLSRYLNRFHGFKPIILIDEYDTPIHAGYIHGYYDQIIMFMRNFLGEGLKDNHNLEFAVVTGILRVAKESIFSGLNNLYVCSLFDESNSTMFGFTEPEVTAILDYYGLSETRDDLARWYDGYRIGLAHMYNPWSINNYIANKGIFDNYWVNVSSNDIVRDLLRHSASSNKRDFEELIKGRTLTKEVYDTIVFEDLEVYPDALWSFLLSSGYLTFNKISREHRMKTADFLIPNEEVLSLFESIVSSWFKRSGALEEYPRMIQCLLCGHIEEFAKLFSGIVRESLSYFDVNNKAPEQFYHAFVLGMLVSLQKDYEVKSNRESGYGRYDVMLIPKDSKKYGIIIEFKKVDLEGHESLESAVEKALQQINDKQYSTELRVRGINHIIELAIAFEGKKVLVKQA